MWKYNYYSELWHAQRGRPKGARVVNGKVIPPAGWTPTEDERSSNGRIFRDGPMDSDMEISYKAKKPDDSRTRQIKAQTSLTNAQNKGREIEAEIEKDRLDRAEAERNRQETERLRQEREQAILNQAVSEAAAAGAIQRLETESRNRINEQNAESQNRINEQRAAGEAEATRILNLLNERNNDITLDQTKIANKLSNKRTINADKITNKNAKEALKQTKISNDLVNKRTINMNKITNKTAKEALKQIKIDNDLDNKEREIDIKQKQKSNSIDNKIRINEDRRKGEADAQKLSAERDKQIISRRAADVLRYDRASKSLDDAGNRLSSGADIVNRISVQEREKMDLSGLSNDELRKQIDRYDLEARYNERFASPTKAARGKRMISNILYGAGVGAKVSGSIASMIASMRSIKKLNFDD